MDFYNLFDSFAQSDIVASMIMPFLDVALGEVGVFDSADVLYDEVENFGNEYNIYKYNTYYIDGGNPEFLEMDLTDTSTQITNNAFYNLISEAITQNRVNNTALSFAQYLQRNTQISEESKNYNVFGSNESENNYYANSVKRQRVSHDSFFKNADVDKIISGIEARLAHELEASPYGVYS